jgi:hypothetical protein
MESEASEVALTVFGSDLVATLRNPENAHGRE